MTTSIDKATEFEDRLDMYIYDGLTVSDCREIILDYFRETLSLVRSDLLAQIEREIEEIKKQDHNPDCQRRMENDFRMDCDCGKYWNNVTLSDVLQALKKIKDSV